MKESKMSKAVHVVIVLILLMICVLTLYPYLNQLAISLNESLDTMKGGVTIFPRKFTLSNYQTVLRNENIYLALIISVSRTVLGTVAALFVTFSAAYALTRRGLKGRKLITWYLCIPSYISAGVIPIYILYRYLGLMNNYMAYVIPFLFSFYNMVIMRSFLQELPGALEESALIDGANEAQIMFRIILPLSMPVVATVSLWIAVFHWNDWTTTLMYVTKSKLYPLQYIMMQIIKESEILQSLKLESAAMGTLKKARPTSEAVQAAVLILTTLPIILVYPFLQRYFISGVVLGAVKE